MNALFLCTLLLTQPEAPSTKPALPDVPNAETWRKQRPAPKAPPTPVLPTFVRSELPNGLTLLVAEVKSLPLVSFRLVTRGGAALDPPKRAGLTSITYAMLQEGSGDLSALAFSDAVADLGASFSAGSGRDHGSVAISGLRRNADEMLELLSEAALDPTFSRIDFERLQNQALASIERRRGSPQGLAFEVLPELIYGAGHPYGHPPSGTLETVSTLVASDASQHHKKIFSPDRSALVAAGHLSLAEAKSLAEKHFGEWNTKLPPLPPIPEVTAQKRDKVVLIDKTNAPQTMVIIGRPMFGRGHEDEAAVAVVNAIYGGNFSSRLNMNLREDKGYSYGAQSQATFRKSVGVFAAFSAVKQDVTDKSVAEFFGELTGLKTKPPTKEEVTQAKQGIIRSLPGEFERTSNIASAATAIFVYDLPLDYYGKVAAKYSAVDEKSAVKVVEKYLDPNMMQLLLVGDVGAIEAPLKKAGLGTITIRQVGKPPVGASK